MSGILNFTIEQVISEINDDLKTNFVGVFPSNHTFRFLNFADLVKEKKAPYPFMIMNTDRTSKKGTHWWSFLEISSKEQIFLFDSLGFVEFFYGLEKMNKNDKKINLTYVQFDLIAYKTTDRGKLTKTTQDFFHTQYEFGRVHNRHVVDVFMVDDQFQDLESETISTLLNEIFTLDENEGLVESFAKELNIKRN